MQNPKFPKELHALALADYALARIDTHAQVYRHAIADYSQELNNKTLFRVLYLMMSVHLQNGNTMLWFGDEHTDLSDDWGLGQAGLVGWQFELVKKLLPFIDEVLGEPYGDFGADVALMMALPKSDLKTFIPQKMDTITAKAHTLGTGEKAQFGELVRLLFGFVYICTVRFGGELGRFYQHLKTLPFFGETSIFVLSELMPSGFGLWFTRSYLAEHRLCVDIGRILSAPQTAIDYVPFDGLNLEQQNAIALALNSSFTIITGGPGTGKTFTVGQLVLHLLKTKPSLKLALVAPTGKAAQRMQESLQKAVGQGVMALPDAMTIHRLLGMGVDGVPRFDGDNALPFDLVVVDEASMLGVELAQKLMSAIATGTRLILLGDANQLSAVDAGAVLGDLCRVPFLTRFHSKLVESRRFDAKSAIGQLAKLIEQNPPVENVLNLLKNTPNLGFVDVKKHKTTLLYDELCMPFLGFFNECKATKLGKLSPQDKADKLEKLFEKLNTYRILTASHQGNVGDVVINDEIAKRHYAHQYPDRPTPSYLPEWYHGRVVMIVKNSYELGLFNGDVGVCLYEHDGKAGTLLVYFDGKETPIPPAMLPSVMVKTSYAMTIHKSQGSEFGAVAVCFDDGNGRLLGRELIYTGITRAKESLTLYATPSSIALAISQETIRQTGLGLAFEKMGVSG